MSLKHMKSLIVLVVGLLSVGCEKGGEITIGEPPKEEPAMNPEQKPLRDSVLGEYELKEDGNTFKIVLLENGVYEQYVNGSKLIESKWSIVDGEIHVEFDSRGMWVYRINSDKSITNIAGIVGVERKDYSKEDQETFKKIN